MCSGACWIENEELRETERGTEMENKTFQLYFYDDSESHGRSAINREALDVDMQKAGLWRRKETTKETHEIYNPSICAIVAGCTVINFYNSILMRVFDFLLSQNALSTRSGHFTGASTDLACSQCATSECTIVRLVGWSTAAHAAHRNRYRSIKRASWKSFDKRRQFTDHFSFNKHLCRRRRSSQLAARTQWLTDA